MIKLQMIGNIGQDARVNEVNGRRSINFSVAHNRKYKNAEGVDVETTTWLNCSYWKNADQSTAIAKYLTAGTKIFVEGIPEVKLYKNRAGQMAASMNILVTQVELLAVRKEGEDVQTGEEPEENGTYGEDHQAGMIRPKSAAHDDPAWPDGDDLPF